MKFDRKFAKVAAAMAGGGLAVALLGVAALYMLIAPTLPSVSSLKEVRFQVPLRIYAVGGELIAEFGDKRRDPLEYEQIPDLMIKAVLSAEDDRFFEHPGVDYHGLLRAAGVLVTTGQRAQGGSTITMQVARNFFLSSEKTFLRKFSEILLALRIEHELSKQDILELYLNKIYFGNHAYGVGAAAHVYYGRDIHQLTLGELAMIAGLPKAPSRFNPIVDPDRAVLRRNYVLRRMFALNFIDESAYKVAVVEPVTATLHAMSIEVEAPYAAEMVRADLYQRYGEDVYTAGYKVHTTIDARQQQAANAAVRDALFDYEVRHGYRGAARHVDLLEVSNQKEWERALAEMPISPGLTPGLVLWSDEAGAAVYARGRRVVWLCGKPLAWALGGREVNEVLQGGDIVHLARNTKGSYALAQSPEVEGALVSLNPEDGAIRAIVGGYDFGRSNYNRVMQARRQPGSSFKPFVYSAALDKGFTPASLINDAPVVFNDPGLEDTWRPENYSGEFFGPTRLRQALVNSRNLVSIRLLRSIGVGYAMDYVKRFGFDTQYLPRDLSLALGSGSVTPLDMARGYAVFANGGYLIDPYVITRIEDPDGKTVWTADPVKVCTTCEQPEATVTAAAEPVALETVSATAQATPPSAEQSQRNAPRVISAQNAYLMTSMMRDVVRFGTAKRALSLGRNDVAGKTGTTNDQKDTWFSGYTGSAVTTVWMGFDKPQPLGEHESGAQSALPIWINFMAEALRGTSERLPPQPPGLVAVRIDPETGLLAGAGAPNAIFEVFLEGSVPKQMTEGSGHEGGGGQGGAANIPEQLF